MEEFSNSHGSYCRAPLGACPGFRGAPLPSEIGRRGIADARCAALRRDLAEIESPPLLDELSDARLERRLAELATHWREVLAGDPPLARQALRALLAGRILIAPEREGYRLRGATKIGALWADAPARVKMGVPRGLRHI